MKQKDKKIENDATRVKRNKKILISIVSLLVTVVLAFGVVIGTVATLRDSRAVVKYGGSSADMGVTSYLSATFKAVFMADIGESYDTLEFWQSEAYSGKTYGEMLEEATLEYIKGVIVGAYLFDRYSSLTKEEREKIEIACNEILDYKAGGSEEQFNSESAAMGFDFDDFKRATELIYKSEMAKHVIYGTNGASLEAGARYEECDTYYNNKFSHVKILYIPTKEKLVTDSDNKLELDIDGKYVTDYYTALEIMERQTDIAEIRRLILGYNNDADEQMSPEFFDLMQEKYNISQEFLDTGYYFSPYSSYTAGFAQESSTLLPDGYREAFCKMLNAVIESSFTLSVGQYQEIEGDYGIVFIYKYANAPYAYLGSTNAAQFHDFFEDAADYLYSSSVSAINPEVSVRDGYSDIDVSLIPYNYKFVATVG